MPELLLHVCAGPDAEALRHQAAGKRLQLPTPARNKLTKIKYMFFSMCLLNTYLYLFNVLPSKKNSKTIH